MRQKPPILNCNNNINCIISPTANVNAAATAATKMLPLSPPVLHIPLKPVRFSALYSLRQWLEPLTTMTTKTTVQTFIACCHCRHKNVAAFAACAAYSA